MKNIKTNNKIDYVFDMVLTEDNKYLILMDEVFVNGGDGSSIGTIWENTHIFNEIAKNFLTTTETLSEGVKTAAQNILESIVWNKDDIKTWVNEEKKKCKLSLLEQAEGQNPQSSNLETDGVDTSSLSDSEEAKLPKGIFKGGILPFLRWVRRNLYTWGGMAIDIVVSFLAVKTNAIVWFIICLLDIYEIITGDYDPKDPSRKESPYLFLTGDLISAIITGAAGKIFQKAAKVGKVGLKSPKVVGFLNELVKRFPSISGWLKNAAKILGGKMKGGGFLSTVLNGMDRVLAGMYQFILKLINPKVGGKAVLAGVGGASAIKGAEYLIGGNKNTPENSSDENYKDVEQILNDPSMELNEAAIGKLFGALSRKLFGTIGRTAINQTTKQLLKLTVDDIVKAGGKFTANTLKKNPNYIRAVAQMADEVSLKTLKVPFKSLTAAQKRQIVPKINQRLKNEVVKTFGKKATPSLTSLFNKGPEIAALQAEKAAGKFVTGSVKDKRLIKLLANEAASKAKVDLIRNSRIAFDALPPLKSSQILNFMKSSSKTLSSGTGKTVSSGIRRPFLWIFSKNGGLKKITSNDLVNYPGFIKRIVVGKTALGLAAKTGIGLGGVYVAYSALNPNGVAILEDENGNDVIDSTIINPNPTYDRSIETLSPCMKEIVQNNQGEIEYNSRNERAVVVKNSNIPEYDNAGGLVFYDSGAVLYMDGSKNGSWSCKDSKIGLQEIAQKLFNEQDLGVFDNVEIIWNNEIPLAPAETNPEPTPVIEPTPNAPVQNNPAVDPPSPDQPTSPEVSQSEPAPVEPQEITDEAKEKIKNSLSKRINGSVVYKGPNLTQSEENYLTNYLSTYYGVSNKKKSIFGDNGIKIIYGK